MNLYYTLSLEPCPQLHYRIQRGCSRGVRTRAVKTRSPVPQAFWMDRNSRALSLVILYRSVAVRAQHLQNSHGGVETAEKNIWDVLGLIWACPKIAGTSKFLQDSWIQSWHKLTVVCLKLIVQSPSTQNTSRPAWPSPSSFQIGSWDLGCTTKINKEASASSKGEKTELGSPKLSDLQIDKSD